MQLGTFWSRSLSTRLFYTRLEPYQSFKRVVKRTGARSSTHKTPTRCFTRSRSSTHWSVSTMKSWVKQRSKSDTNGAWGSSNWEALSICTPFWSHLSLMSSLAWPTFNRDKSLKLGKRRERVVVRMQWMDREDQAKDRKKARKMLRSRTIKPNA